MKDDIRAARNFGARIERRAIRRIADKYIARCEAAGDLDTANMFRNLKDSLTDRVRLSQNRKGGFGRK
jgi:hypothetical protein